MYIIYMGNCTSYLGSFPVYIWVLVGITYTISVFDFPAAGIRYPQAARSAGGIPPGPGRVLSRNPIPWPNRAGRGRISRNS